jgi:hypothetical protein
MSGLTTIVMVLLTAAATAPYWKPPSDPGLQSAVLPFLRRPHPFPDTPHLVVLPGRRSEHLDRALRRVQEAAPHAVRRGLGGSRRFALVPPVRQALAAALEDDNAQLTETDSQALQHAARTSSTCVLPPWPSAARRIPASSWIMHSAARIIPDGDRWHEEWLAEYQAMQHRPLRARVRFLAGLLISAPSLAWTTRRCHGRL